MRTPSVIVAELDHAFVNAEPNEKLYALIRELRAAIDVAESTTPQTHISVTEGDCNSISFDAYQNQY